MQKKFQNSTNSCANVSWNFTDSQNVLSLIPQCFLNAGNHSKSAPNGPIAQPRTISRSRTIPANVSVNQYLTDVGNGTFLTVSQRFSNDFYSQASEYIDYIIHHVTGELIDTELNIQNTVSVPKIQLLFNIIYCIANFKNTRNVPIR